MKSQIDKENGTVQSYIAGLIACIFLTLVPYYVVTRKLLTGWQEIATIVTFALIQTVVQLFLFLHLGAESKPRWNLMIFWFMLLVLFILVLGSIWIMFNLNYQMMDM